MLLTTIPVVAFWTLWRHVQRQPNEMMHATPEAYSEQGRAPHTTPFPQLPAVSPESSQSLFIPYSAAHVCSLLYCECASVYMCGSLRVDFMSPVEVKRNW